MFQILNTGTYLTMLISITSNIIVLNENVE